MTMHLEDFLNKAFAQHKTRFICVVGYTVAGVDYTDVQIYGTDKVPDIDYMDFVTTFYKPLEIRGMDRNMIWVDAYDKHGKLDLPAVLNTGTVSYYANT